MNKLKKSLLLTIAFIVITPLSIAAQNSNISFSKAADSDQLQWGNCPDFMPDSCEIAVLQGDPAKPNADIFFKMQGNSSVPNHWHHSAERMVLVSGEMEVNYKGQKPAVIETKMYAYGPPEKPHSASCISDDPCVLFIAFNKPVDAFLAE
ncbi:MAG: cupin domain-containing protein [Bacteroidetes bacterium]|jgi:quercetin dioxygenase-like cupin family protein|nr:cupin domain-containing protein [Bacteroidota bacterium]